MIRINQIKIKHDLEKLVSDQELHDMLKKYIVKLLRIDKGNFGEIEIIRRSIDARKKPEIYDIYLVDVTLKGLDEKKVVNKCKSKDVVIKERDDYDFDRQVKEIIRRRSEERDTSYITEGSADKSISDDDRIIVIGAGPAGLFCGYMLAKKGYKPIVLERGADVDKRTAIVEHFWKTGELNTSTNVQFGEGGAGTFSDGKLNTMVKDKDGRGREALKIFVSHGAQEEILYDAKPHIGTDILREVVRNLRKSIIEMGGEVHFETKVTEILIDESGRLTGVVTESATGNGSGDEHSQPLSEKISCSKAVLAIGHSARDTFYMLKDKKVNMEKKPFAVGFRVEHPQSIINKSQYGIEDPKTLPPAPYKLTTTTDGGRGVYSFCMCPGGYVVNASSEEGRLAVNGMSYSKRDGNNANSAIIVTVDPKDFGSDDILGGVEFQRRLEEKAFKIGHGKIPVEFYGDFKKAVIGKKETLNNFENVENTTVETFSWKIDPFMRGEYVFSNVHEILPDELNDCFVQGMEKFGKIIKGYNCSNALVSGVESRTSSPVRIVRDENCESINIKGLYPCGEGAGYAGGIMSAAMDGMKVAEYIVADIISC
ncbi:MAG: FAD-dependent oxidoreductase [Butyrivibrio sp.]|nr:FAD-dependent oxidoreductase [Butyrivibrio sp.]